MLPNDGHNESGGLYCSSMCSCDVFMEKGTLIVQKKREFQQSFTPFLTDHFVVAQQMFGTSACLGIYIFVPCNLTLNEESESFHEVSKQLWFKFYDPVSMYPLSR